MLNFKSITLTQTKQLLAILGLSLALTGCALDDIASEDTFEPYGGSKQHPIKVANGKATVGKCDDWSENVADTADNALMDNHGCAVQSNIAAMTANPNDLVRARRMSKSPAFSRTDAVKGLAGGGATSPDTTTSAKP